MQTVSNIQTNSRERSLNDLKKIIDRTIESTLECGMALKEIRDRKLYLEECGSFEEFCDKNWHVTRQRAYQLIDYANVVIDLPADVSTVVDTERAARALKPVPKEKRAGVVRKAAANGPVTADSIKAAAAESDKPEPVYDRTGFEIPIPSPAIEHWIRAEEIQEMLTGIIRIKSALIKGFDARDPMFIEINSTTFIADIQSSYNQLKVALPYAVCPTCQGRVLSECKTCGNRGVVSEFYWKHKVPDDIKKIRERAVTKSSNTKKK